MTALHRVNQAARVSALILTVCAEVARRALADYLEEVKFDNCEVNDGYFKALGSR